MGILRDNTPPPLAAYWDSLAVVPFKESRREDGNVRSLLAGRPAGLL